METQVLPASQMTAAPVAIPPKRSRVRWPIAAAGALALAVALFLIPASRRAITGALPGAPARPHTVLAILPFTSDQGPELSALAGGISQTLPARLGSVERLREQATVVPPSDLVARKIDDPALAMKNLGATLAVAGKLVRASDGRLRLTLRLLDRNRKEPAEYVVEDGAGDLRVLEDRAA